MKGAEFSSGAGQMLMRVLSAIRGCVGKRFFFCALTRWRGLSADGILRMQAAYDLALVHAGARYCGGYCGDLEINFIARYQPVTLYLMSSKVPPLAGSEMAYFLLNFPTVYRHGG